MKLTFLGDIMCDYYMSKNIDNYFNDKKNYDFSMVFKPIQSFFCDSDYVFANLETPISLDNKNLTNQMWQFYSPYEFAEAIKNCGVDFVSTANNHCLDRGKQGLFSTINSLDKLGFAHCGTYLSSSKRKPYIINIRDKKIGILAYTYGTNAVTNYQYLDFKDRRLVDLIQEQEGYVNSFLNSKPILIKKVFRKLLENKYESFNTGKEWFERRTYDGYRKRLVNKDIQYFKKHHVDLIVGYIHIGGQYNTIPNFYTKETVDWLLDKGVNIVIANHEHVVHGCKFDIRNNKIATYALGNFLGSAGVLKEPKDKRSEYSVILNVYLDNDTNRFDNITFSVTKTIYNTVTKQYEVWSVFDLFSKLNGKEKEKLFYDVILVAEIFSGKKYDAVLKEYDLL